MPRGRYVRTLEHRKLMSEKTKTWLKNNTHPNLGKPSKRRGISRAPLSEKQKQKIRVALRRWHANNEHMNWKGGTRLNKQGYLLKRENDKYKLVHRKIMEEVIGRRLLSREVVHHWDENKTNNALFNLALLRHSTAHNRLHGFAKKHNLEISQLRFEQPWIIAE